jgi:ribonuclease Z
LVGRVGILVLGLATLLCGFFLTWQLWRYREVAQGVVWLPDRSFEEPTLVTVGTGAGAENPSRLGPATAIGSGDRLVLVDAGRGVAEALRRCSIPVAQPDTVLLTSLLPENVVGLDDLLLTGWNQPRPHPLRLIGPPGTGALAKQVVSAYAPAVEALARAREVPADGATLDVLEVDDGWSETRGGLSVRAARVGDSPVASLAFRFDDGRGAFVVAGVDPDPDRLAALADGAAVLVTEGFYPQSVEMAIAAGAREPDRLRREAALHLPMPKVAEVAARAGVGTLVLTRLTPPPLFDQQYRTLVGEGYRGRIVVAHDCDELTR